MTLNSNMITIHIDPVASLESYRALKLSRFESFSALNVKIQNDYFLILNFANLESFRALQLSRLESFWVLNTLLIVGTLFWKKK